jgi:hypothetical protein
MRADKARSAVLTSVGEADACCVGSKGRSVLALGLRAWHPSRVATERRSRMGGARRKRERLPRCSGSPGWLVAACSGS